MPAQGKRQVLKLATAMPSPNIVPSVNLASHSIFFLYPTLYGTRFLLATMDSKMDLVSERMKKAKEADELRDEAIEVSC